MAVALRKESVDRNIASKKYQVILGHVALRKESVDRNSIALASFRVCITSLSARRAWIEITYVTRLPRAQVSLSARRAWIEIKYVVKDSDFSGVALRKESVDRNEGDQLQSGRDSQSLSARRAWIEIISSVNNK